MDDEINFEDFQEYLGKYSKFLNNNNDEQNASFLDLPETPSESQIVSLFINDDDVKYSVEASGYDINELGKPDINRIIEGVVWSVMKNSWAVPDGNVVSFLLIKTKLDEEDLTSIEKFNLDNAHTNSDTKLDYNELLGIAVANEDYPEAARLRDWYSNLKEMLVDLSKVLEDGDITHFYNELEVIKKYKKLL